MKTKRRRSKQYPTQDRLGFKVGDRVRVKPIENAVLPEDRDFYGQNVGVIECFLDDPTAANNGAALLTIKTKTRFRVEGGRMMRLVTQPFIDTDRLIRA